MSNLPTGTVTFLFTDIEGSTQIAQQYPEAWEFLRGRHHEILREAIESNDGYVFQIVGDEFCVAFHTALQALNAALDAQSRLQNENWNPVSVKVRMGINTGAAQVGDVTDPSGGYTGYAALARVNRVMSAGHGGQLLLSSASAELVCNELPQDVTLRDMGEQRLKGLLNTEHLWQVEAPGLMCDFPPLRTLNAVPNNLPSQLTSFIGREKEIAAIKEELASHRLVTLVGPGGTGKSRLSLQIAADVLNAYPHGVWFVELAALSDSELVPQTILSSLSLAEQKGKTPLQTLEDYLHDKNLLLILDNCEHLIEACARVVAALLKVSSPLKVLASSRELLGISGELAWPVPSLSLPNPKFLPEPEQLTQYESVRLFVDRVQLVSPHFTMMRENASAIAQICHRLDGIPLALELAAARARSMSVEQIASRLDDRFRLLTGGSRTALPRQQTLRALIDWSYDLLTENEQLLLRRLAVFAGGWNLETAEQVCADSKLDSFDILNMLTRLVDKSLVAVDVEQGGMRYHILETVRQYASEKLFESGEGVEMRNRHSDAFMGLVEEASPELKKDHAKKWFETLDLEQDNVRTALWWFIENNNVESAIRTSNALEYYWRTRDLTNEGYNFYSEVFDLAERNRVNTQTARYVLLWANKVSYSFDVKLNLFTEPAALEATLQIVHLLEYLNYPAGSFRIFYRLDGLYEIGNDLDSAEKAILKALNGFREAGHQEDVALALCSLSEIYYERGDIEKSDEMDIQARDIFLKIGYTTFAVRRVNFLANKSYLRGNFKSAQKEFEASLRTLRKLDNVGEMQSTLDELGNIAVLQGDYAKAKKYDEEIELCSKKFADQRWQTVYNHLYAGRFAFITNDLETARHHFLAALEGIKDNQADIFAGTTLMRLGFTSLYLRQMDDARQYFEQGMATMKKVAQESDAAFYWYGLGEMERIAGNITVAIQNYQQALFQRKKFQKYVYIPDLLDGFAKLVISQSDFIGAARWLGAADGLRKRFGIVMYPVYRPDYDRHIELLKNRLSAEELQSAWDDGEKMKLDEAVALALQDYEPEQ